MTVYDDSHYPGNLDKNFARNALLFFTGLCAASCGVWEAMGTIL